MRPLDGAGRSAAAVTAVALAAHVVPAATWLPRLRRVCFPTLAGIGRPDHVALTFDDGPDPESTASFLDVLDALDARATFFVLGERLTRARHVGREIAARGHELAVHGWTHAPRWLPAPLTEAAGVARTAAAVEELSGVPPLWYRPPFGVLTADRLFAARTAGLRPVLWSAWGRDWTAGATPASVLATVREGLRGGGTVLLHDTDGQSAPGCWKSSLAALPGLVAGCRSAGLAVGPLREHWIGR